MRTLLVILAILILTPVVGGLVIIASLLGVKDSPNGIYQWAAKTWARGVCAAAGMRVHVTARERREGRAHLRQQPTDLFDIFALAGY